MLTQGTIRPALKSRPTPGSYEPAASITRIRDSILAGMIIAAVAVSGCGGSAAKPQASSAPSSAPSSAATSASSSSGLANGVPAAPPPAGYKWAGSAAQGVFLAVPDSWAAIDLAKISLTQAVERFWPKGVSSTLMATLRHLSQQRAIFVADLASAVQSSHQFATNGNAFCAATPVASGTGLSSALKALMRAEYAQIGVHDIVFRDVTIDGDTGVQANFTITTAGGIKLTDTQYTVLTKNSRLCYITLTTDNPMSFKRIFGVIGSTIFFS
jgi:hypothetical protein